MALSGVVGRKTARARFAMFMVYGILALGAVTTVYPFLEMISTGFKSAVDQNDNLVVPKYWYDLASLQEKFSHDKYGGNSQAIAVTRTGTAGADNVARYRAFLQTLPEDYFQAGFQTSSTGVTGRLDLTYQAWLRTQFSSIQALDKVYTEEDLSFSTVSPPVELFNQTFWAPTPSPKWNDWLKFKRQLPGWFRLPVTARVLFQNWTRNTYHNQIDLVPAELRKGAASFDDLLTPVSGPYLKAFEAKGLPDRYRKDTVESLWLKFNGKAVTGDPIVAGAKVVLPIEAAERDYVHDHQAQLKWEFATRDYRYVIDYLLVTGNAFWNTLLYCGLSIIVTIFVNCLAAYALSRYPIKASGKILIFLLATMAFPAEVAMIPNFLLLKEFHLLNTFTGLVLPGAASGYFIFLMKGFFDSLPQELFEAGAIDGANEGFMLRRIALPLSKPVMGYFTLIIFFAAYSNFIFAFLIAQDHRVWTLMVFIYQLNEIAPKHVMMAAFTLAALPTMVVFLLAQKTIDEGIVLPSDK